MMQASLEGEFVSIFLKIKSKLWAEIQSQIESEGKSISEPGVGIKPHPSK